MKEFDINSIYLATEGEGVHVGTPQVFIRFQGCHIGCLNCDSKDTWEFDIKKIKEEDLIAQIKKESLDYKIKRFSITGGDPLHPKLVPQVEFVINHLKNLFSDCFINIEASGSRIVHDLFLKLDFISFDFKTPSTGVKTPVENVIKMLLSFSQKCQIKSVVENRDDMDAVFESYQIVCRELKLEKLPWCITPSYNTHEKFPQKRFQNILEWNYSLGIPFRVIGQQHKWIFGPDLKQV